MNVGNTQNTPNFGAKFFIAGKRDPLIENPQKAIEDAFTKAADAGNAIIEHCREKNIPLFMEANTSESASLPIYRELQGLKPAKIEELADTLVEHSFLIGEDATAFKKAINNGGYSPMMMEIPEENTLNAADVLAAIKNRTFDFINGTFLKEPLPEEKIVATQKQKNFFQKRFETLKKILLVF